MKSSSWINRALESFSGHSSRRRRKNGCLAKPTFSQLETRNLLATFIDGTTTSLPVFQSDPGQADAISVEVSDTFLRVRVGNGDAIELGGPVDPAIRISSFESFSDTLTIDLTAGTVNLLEFNLGDQNDTFTVSGSSSNFVIYVYGGLGDDLLDASDYFVQGSLLMFGDDGADEIKGSRGSDSLRGGAGDDLIVGNGGPDFIEGGDGDDTLRGNGGDDFIRGDAGNDKLNGGPGRDRLTGGEGDDFLVGLGGADEADGGAGFDTLSFQKTQGLVNAVIRDDGSGANNTAGNDPFEANAPVVGLIDTFSGIERVVGSEGDDIIRVDGTRPTNVLGLGGNDQLTGGSGDDILVGGDGDDTLAGSSGDDRLDGGDGDDVLLGGTGIDVIRGRNGNDTNSFEDIQFGVTATVKANGNGSARYSDENETFTGVENLTGTNFADVLKAAASGGSVLRGLGGDDILTGGDGDDTLIGNAGDDILRGNGGDDFAIGGNGNDKLNGGDGNDRLSGNRGDDFFVGIEGRDLIHGGEGHDINSFAGIDTGVTATINADGSGTALHRNNINELFFGIESLHGSSHDDHLTVNGGTGYAILGFDGNDQLFGGSGNDRLVGGNGDDVLRGYAGDDLLYGQAGIDRLFGGLGDDMLFDASGEDILSDIVSNEITGGEFVGSVTLGDDDQIG